jgi:hypothetical protein
VCVDHRTEPNNLQQLAGRRLHHDWHSFLEGMRDHFSPV